MKNTYHVNRISKSQELILNGKGSNDLWKQAQVMNDFCSPWDSEKIKKIEFRALHDDEKLFFCFKVFDSELHINPSKNTMESINNSDRVELFFRSDLNMNPYYCLEIDPTGRIMDFKARPEKKFDFNWSWPSNHIQVESMIREKFYVVEGFVTMESLFDFDLVHQNSLQVGVFRAKYKSEKSKSFRPSWITWVDPKTNAPNFHIESSFGIFKLM